jgi:hypothetical protein
MECIKVDCPDCGRKDGVTASYYEDFNDDGHPSLAVDLVRQDCSCELMDGPFDDVRDRVKEMHSNCYPYAIRGSWVE